MEMGFSQSLGNITINNIQTCGYFPFFSMSVFDFPSLVSTLRCYVA